MSMHDGHRQRMKTRFLEYGLDNFDDFAVLELLLFFALPRQDTNAVAHELISHFGSLSGVMEASADELRGVSGLGDHAVTLLRLIPALTKRYMLDKTPASEPIDTPAAAGRYFLPRFMYEREEIALALLLDARKRPICCAELSRGVVNAVEFNTRRLVELALQKRASSVILAHNHLSGVALPSAEDERATAGLRQALSLVGIVLSDHIVIAGCEYVSMAECGAL